MFSTILDCCCAFSIHTHIGVHGSNKNAIATVRIKIAKRAGNRSQSLYEISYFSSCPFSLQKGRRCSGLRQVLLNHPHQSHEKLRCRFQMWNRTSPPQCVLLSPLLPSCFLFPNELTCMMNISAHGLSNRHHIYCYYNQHYYHC